MNLSEPVLPSGPLPTAVGQALPHGSMLEDYEIVQVLGLTSFGVLYFARHTLDGSTVAIKEYMPSSIARRGANDQIEPNSPAEAQAFDRGLQAFLTEALTLSQFEHPNLLRVNSIWEANGTAYRAMPYLAGTTLLLRRTASRVPASQAQLRLLYDGLLAALHTLYEAGLAHGQVEPVNIHLGEDEIPSLMDFDAVHQAVLSNPDQPHLDAYADPAKFEQMVTADLRAVAAVLHFAISGDWAALRPDQTENHAPLAEVLLRHKDSASVLDYQPDFLAAIDTALSLPPADRPGTITEFRALFEAMPILAGPVQPAPASQGATQEPKKTTARRPRREPLPSPPPAYPLNTNESVLALLANFDRGPAPAAEDVEPFQIPEVPTLTEEAEPALPPLRDNPFDTIEAGEEPPHTAVGYTPVGYTPLGYTPMPRIRRNPWRRRATVAGIALAVLAGVSTLGWQLFS